MPTKRPMAGHKGTPQYNYPSIWAELKNNPTGKANANITNMAATEGTPDKETSY